MIQALEADIDEKGRVSLREPVRLPAARRAIVTVLDEPPAAPAEPAEPQAGGGHECCLMSESALAKDWLRPEEDEAWEYLDEIPDDCQSFERSK